MLELLTRFLDVAGMKVKPLGLGQQGQMFRDQVLFLGCVGTCVWLLLVAAVEYSRCVDVSVDVKADVKAETSSSAPSQFVLVILQSFIVGHRQEAACGMLWCLYIMMQPIPL